MSERKIDEATMDNVEILAKLALTPQERQKAMDEMEKILTYVFAGPADPPTFR